MSVDRTELIALRCQLGLINVVITKADDGWLANEYASVSDIFPKTCMQIIQLQVYFKAPNMIR